MPGKHNVQNALAAIAVGVEMEIDEETIRSALAGFKGVKRRFTKTGEAGGITVIDDYGHHPVEIAAVLRAAVAKDRENPFAWYQLGMVYGAKGDLPSARAIFGGLDFTNYFIALAPIPANIPMTLEAVTSLIHSSGRTVTRWSRETAKSIQAFFAVAWCSSSACGAARAPG